MTDAAAEILQILDGTPHAHLFRRFDGGEWCLNTDWRTLDPLMCDGLRINAWIEWNGHGYYITVAGRKAVREWVREFDEEDAGRGEGWE